MGFVKKEWAEGEVDLGIHEDDVGVIFEGGEAVLSCGTDGVGGLDEDIDGVVFEKEVAICVVDGTGVRWLPFRLRLFHPDQRPRRVPCRGWRGFERRWPRPMQPAPTSPMVIGRDLMV